MALHYNFACFSCCQIFKKDIWGCSDGFPKYNCPNCGEQMRYMGHKFRAPPKSKKKEWRKIETAIRRGQQWEVRTIRKEDKVRPKRISRRLGLALGVVKK